MSNESAPRVLVFGVFDRLHDGHRYFLEQAARYGLVTVALTPEAIVRRIKKKTPAQSFYTREAQLTALQTVHTVVPADTTLGSWEILKRVSPDCIVLGYDQHGLREALEAVCNVPIHTIDAYKPDELHSSLLAGSDG